MYSNTSVMNLLDLSQTFFARNLSYLFSFLWLVFDPLASCRQFAWSEIVKGCRSSKVQTATVSPISVHQFKKELHFIETSKAQHGQNEKTNTHTYHILSGSHIGPL